MLFFLANYLFHQIFLGARSVPVGIQSKPVGMQSLKKFLHDFSRF